MQHRYHLLVSVAAIVLVGSVLGFSQNETANRLTSPVVASQRTVTNGVHPLATKQSDLGRVTGAQVFHRMVLLTQRSAAQEADLEQLLQEQQDPSSPKYHQWLTPAEFGERFGPSANDMARITGWLESQGFTVENPPNGRQYLLFTGTSAQVESAFQTEMHRYGVNGKTYVANAKPASIPTALAPAVSGVASLNSFTEMAPGYHTAATPQIEINKAALTGPADLSAVYDAAPLTKANVLGQGQSIALIEQSNIVLQDVTDFRKITGLPAATLNVIVNGTDPGPVNGDETEAIADVEYAGALAPDATLNVVVTGTTDFNQGVDLSTAYAVDNDIAPIAALSYGGCETLNDTFASTEVELYKLAYEQGAAEGISHFVSAGDYGGDACEYTGLTGYGVNAIGDSPWNVSVGGTEFIMPDANVYFPPPSYTATGYIPETTWNDYENPEDGRPLAGGGGVSINFSKPAWQTGPGVPADGARDVPDVSLVAGDDLAYMVCEADAGGDCSQGDALGLIGTSLSNQVWAGIQALVNQQNNEVGGAGNPNPTYYRLAAGSNSPFHDITVGNTDVPCYCSGGGPYLLGYEATPGYDLATGLGSVDVNKLVTGWLPTTGSGAATVTLSTGGVTSIEHGDALTATVTVTGSGATAPTGDVVLMAGSQGVDRITLGATGTATVTFGAVAGVELPGGSYNLTAHYAGDTNFAAANSSAVALTVSAEPTTTVASSSVTGAVPYGTPITLMAAAYGNNSGTGYPVPGTYTFTAGATTLGTATLPATGEGLAFVTSGGTVSLTFGQSTTAVSAGTPVLGAGRYQVVAASPGASASFQASTSAPATVVVTKGPVVVSLTPSSNNTAANTSVNLAVSVMPIYEANNELYLSVAPVTGNVDFYDTSTTPETKLGTATLSGSAATLPVTFSATGLHAIVAQYDGDANDLANSSGAVDITVSTKVSTTTIISGGYGFTYAPTPITLTATVIGEFTGTAPTGTVTFTDASANNGAGATIGTATLGAPADGAALATLNTSTLSAGTHNVTASYSGDANYIGSASMAAEVSVIAMTLAPTTASATVTAGQNTAVDSISFSTNPIFTNYYYWYVNLSCSGLPSGAACVFTPATFDPTYNSTTGILSGSSSFSIYTNGPTLQKAATTPQRNPWGGFGMLTLASLLAFGFRRRWRRMFVSVSALAMLVFFLGLGGCGGSGGSGAGYNITNQGTPAGTYPVTVTGTMIVEGFGTYTTTTTFNLTVTAAGQ
jgi:subtilase family serine protease